jgi:hypothetical protein
VRRTWPRWTSAASLVVLFLATPAVAQQATDQADKDSGLVARAKAYIAKQRDARERVEEPDGFYPRIGGLTTGSGLTLGGGYRAHLRDRAFYADVSGVLSTKWYVGGDARLRFPSPLPRLELWSSLAFRRFTQEDYFGLGSESLLDNRTNYAIHSLDVGGQAIVRVAPWLRVGSDIGYFMPRLREGTDPKWPPIERLFDATTAPGLFEQPEFLHYGIFTTVDYRDERGNPRSGGYYRATLAQWNDRTLGRYDFRRFDSELHQFVPLGSGRHVLAGRFGLSYVNNDPGDAVPFYVFPSVGGANTVRSLAEFRFRDENAMYFTGEYRFGIHKYVQLVGFADAGKVAHDWQDVNLHDLTPAYGAGVRAGTENRTFVRVDVGTGAGEGTRLFIKFLPTF